MLTNPTPFPQVGSFAMLTVDVPVPVGRPARRRRIVRIQQALRDGRVLVTAASRTMIIAGRPVTAPAIARTVGLDELRASKGRTA